MPLTRPQLAEALGIDLRLAQDDVSIAELVAETPDAEWREAVSALSEDDAAELLYSWAFWGRPKQQTPPDPWFCWLLLSGRGFGKTRTGAEWVRAQAERAAETGQPIRIALVAETAADARDVLIQGDSGLLSISRPAFMPKYEASKRRLTWPDGTTATLFSGEEPDQLRGPQFHKAWLDELAKYQYAQETWDNLELGLRLGDNPQVVVTTTPRPIPIIRRLLADPHVVTTRGTTYENLANLAPTFISRVVSRYEGTRTGRQELHAEVLLDTPGALWTSHMIETTRIERSRAPSFVRTVVGVDPSVTSFDAIDEHTNECGIVVVAEGVDGHVYVLADRSGQLSPDQWARRVLMSYYNASADRIVAEANNGGDMVRLTLHTVDRNAAVRMVHAQRAKKARAEPVAALYEQGRVHHVGLFPALEDQMTTWTPEDDSPDRLDALVWAITDLKLRRHEPEPLPPTRSRRTFR